MSAVDLRIKKFGLFYFSVIKRERTLFVERERLFWNTYGLVDCIDNDIKFLRCNNIEPSYCPLMHVVYEFMQNKCMHEPYIV